MPGVRFAVNIMFSDCGLGQLVTQVNAQVSYLDSSRKAFHYLRTPRVQHESVVEFSDTGPSKSSLTFEGELLNVGPC